METLLLKDIVDWVLGVGGTMGVLAVGVVVWFHRRVNKNGKMIAEQIIEDTRHQEILTKHDTAIQLLKKDVGYIKKQGDTMDKKLDRLLEK